MSTLTKAVKEAKKVRRMHPNRYNGKKNPWRHYLSEGFNRVARGKSGHKRRVVSGTKKRKPTRRKPGKVRISDRTEMILMPAVGRVRHHRPHKRKKHHKAKRVSGVRRVSGTGGGMGTALLIGGALVLGYLLLKPKTPTTGVTAASLVPTGNATRDAQASNILAYATAIGIAGSSLAAIIQKLNTGSDSSVASMSTAIQDQTGQVTADQWQAWYDGD